MRPLFALGILLCAGLQVIAQEPREQPHKVFKVDTDLVLVPVNVVNRKGAIVNGLHGDAFSVFDNRNSEQIFSFSEQDVPASVGVILDVSGSMRPTLTQAKLAVRSFLDTANPADEAFLYSVSSRPNRNAG